MSVHGAFHRDARWRASLRTHVQWLSPWDNKRSPDERKRHPGPPGEPACRSLMRATSLARARIFGKPRTTPDFYDKDAPRWKNFPTNCKAVCASSSSAPLPASGRPIWAITTRIPAIAFGARSIEVGITPRRYQPHEFPALLKLGIGFTDLCKSGAGMDHQALAFPDRHPGVPGKDTAVPAEDDRLHQQEGREPVLRKTHQRGGAGPTAAAGRFSHSVRAGLALRRRIGPLVGAALAGAGGFGQRAGWGCVGWAKAQLRRAHLRVDRAPFGGHASALAR